MRIFYGHRPTSSATHYRIDGGGAWSTKIVWLVRWIGPGWHCSVFRGPRVLAGAATCSSSGLRGDRRWTFSHAWIGYSLSGCSDHEHHARRSRERACQEWFFRPEWRIRVCPPSRCRRFDTGIRGPRLAVIGRSTRPLPQRRILGRGCAADWHHWGRSPTYAAPPGVRTADCNRQVVAHSLLAVPASPFDLHGHCNKGKRNGNSPLRTELERHVLALRVRRPNETSYSRSGETRVYRPRQHGTADRKAPA